MYACIILILCPLLRFGKFFQFLGKQNINNNKTLKMESFYSRLPIKNFLISLFYYYYSLLDSKKWVVSF